VYVCLPTAVVLLAAGVYGDSRGWWEDQAFLTNLFSSLTSLLFGVPTALLLINSIGEAQAQAREQRRVRAAVRPEVQELEALLLRRFRVGSLDELQQRCSGIRQGLAQASQRRQDIRPLIDMFADFYEPRDAAGNSLSREASRQEQVVWVRSLRAQWEFLDNDLRPRAVQAGIEWVPHQWSGRVKEDMEALDPVDGRTLDVDSVCDALSQIAAVSLRLKQLYGQ